MFTFLNLNIGKCCRRMWKQYMETHAGLRHQTAVLQLAHKDRQVGIHLPTSDPSARPKPELGLRFPPMAFCRGRFWRLDQKPAQRSLNYICVGNHVVRHSNHLTRLLRRRVLSRTESFNLIALLLPRLLAFFAYTFLCAKVSKRGMRLHLLPGP